MKKYIILILLGMTISSFAVPAIIINGFDKIIKASNSGKYFCFNNELVESYWEYPNRGKESIIWQTSVVPAQYKDKNIIFMFACGMGSGKGTKGKHTVYINGKKLGQFTVCLKETQKLAKGITFKPLQMDMFYDLFGIINLSIPAKLINYGKRQVIKIKGDANKTKAWFMVSAIKMPSESEVEIIHKKNRVNEKIKQHKRLLKKLDSDKLLFAQALVCKWYKNKKAAVSIVSSPPSEDNVTLCQGKNNSLASIRDIVDEAIKKKTWLLEIWSQKKVPLKHAEYLRTLECLIWLADIQQIKDYIKLRNTLKIKQKKHGDIITITLEKMPEDKLKQNLITVYVPIPEGICWAKVSAKDKKLQLAISSYTYLGKKIYNGFIFSLAPVDFPVVLKLEKE